MGTWFSHVMNQTAQGNLDTFNKFIGGFRMQRKNDCLFTNVLYIKAQWIMERGIRP